MTTLLLLKGESLEALKAQILAEYGTFARIVKAESVVQGGIGGFLAKRYFEVTVEVPTPERARDPHAGEQGGGPAPAGGMVLPNRSGIAALLADADEAEDRLADPLTFSTSSARFDQLFDELSARVSSVEAAVPAVEVLPAIEALPATRQLSSSGFAGEGRLGLPSSVASVDARERALRLASSPFPLSTSAPDPAPAHPATPPLPAQAAGDLVLLVGLRTDALRVAHSLSGRFGPAAVCVGGTITLKSALTVSDRRTAAHARADGVNNGCSVFVAYGVEPGSDVTASIRDIGADQVWVVVDAGRKHEDTRVWVHSVADRVEVHAVAAFGLATTLTPESVQDLGIPVGWADGLLLGA